MSESRFQELLNIAYDDWQVNNKWSLEDMLNNARFKHGEVCELACLLGKYHQQVTNGGHSQYFENGYCGTQPRSWNQYSFEAQLTQRMLQQMQQFDLYTAPLGKVVFEIASDFVRITEEIGELNEDLLNEYNELDRRYYAISDQWEEVLEGFFLTHSK